MGAGIIGRWSLVNGHGRLPRFPTALITSKEFPSATVPGETCRPSALGKSPKRKGECPERGRAPAVDSEPSGTVPCEGKAQARDLTLDVIADARLVAEGDRSELGSAGTKAIGVGTKPDHRSWLSAQRRQGPQPSVSTCLLNDEGTHHEAIMDPANIEFQRAAVHDVLVRVVHKCDESAAVGVGLIPLDVDVELLANLSCAKSCTPRHLGLNHDLLGLQQKVHSRSSTSSRWGEVLWADVVEEQPQYSLEGHLNVVLVLDYEWLPITTTPREWLRELGEAAANSLEQL